MRHRVLAVGLAALVIFWALGFAQSAAQTAATVSISVRSDQIDEVLARGRVLEGERRWAEALTHYEDAVRQYPGNPSLQQRFAVARQYFDLSRRYADASFCRNLKEANVGQALDLYGQVMLKVQSYYVDAPDWRGLVDHGTFALEIALSEPAFVDRHLSAAAGRKVESFLRELHTTIDGSEVGSRTQACDAVAAAASLAEQHLGLPATAVVLEYLCGACNALDQYSSYLTSDQLDEVYSQIEGNFVGLGVELKAQDGLLTVVRVIAGSPAQQAGLMSGDQLLAVDGQRTSQISSEKAANLLQGQEGSLVHLVVAAPGQASRSVVARRRRVDVPSVDVAEMADPEAGVAYLRLTCFQKTTCRDIDTALWKLHQAGMRQLIVDVRGNPGGLLVTAVEVADRFLEQGVIVSTRGRSVHEDYTYTARVEGTWRVPLVVLIDDNSASAAEIFAGAIHDLHRGTVIGSRSFGKGSVQGIFTLDGFGGGLRLTTAKFYSPTGRGYSNVGVEPDIRVHTVARTIESANPLAEKDDPVLRAAIDTARGTYSTHATAQVGR